MVKIIIICAVVLALAAVLYFRNKKKNELVITNTLVAVPDVVYVNDNEREANITVYSYRRFRRGNNSEIESAMPVVTPLNSPLSIDLSSEIVGSGTYKYKVKVDKNWVFDENLEDNKELGKVTFTNKFDNDGRTVRVLYKKIIKAPSVNITLEKIIDEKTGKNTFGLKVVIPEDMPSVNWSVNGTYKITDKGENEEISEINGKFTLHGDGTNYEKLFIEGVTDVEYKGEGLFISGSQLRGTLDKRRSKLTYGETVVE